MGNASIATGPGRLERARWRALGAFARATLALPASLRRAAFGVPPRNDRGDGLDPDVHVLARLEAIVSGPLTRGDIGASRAGMRQGSGVASRPRPAGLVVRAATIAGRPARLYLTPAAAVAGRSRGAEPPLLLYYHGGGWALGDLDTHDGLCARIAAEAGWSVLAVDYRLAPEHPCPAAFDDALAALRAAPAWAEAAGLGAPAIAVGGDSAGGNLAAAVSVAVRDAGEAVPALQLLIYPALDLRRLTLSHRSCADGPLLTSADIDHFLALFAAPDVEDLSVSPGLVADARGLPPAIVTTAGFDPLRDEGEDFVALLAAASVACTHLHAASMPHGYASMDGICAEADREVGRIVAALREQAAQLAAPAAARAAGPDRHG